MKKSEIFQEVIECFDDKKDIEDEMLFFILDRMSERFVESQEDTEWQTYGQLLDRLDKIWQYQQFEALTSEQSYLYGGIWGCLSMLSCIKKKKEASQKCYTTASKYEADAAFAFLNAINESPGLQNKKLAQLCSVTTARISQISNEALKDGLISAQTMGKEKSYYIRTMGERVLDIVKKNKEKLAKSRDQAGYKLLVVSNFEDNMNASYPKMKSFIDIRNRNNNCVWEVCCKKRDETVSNDRNRSKIERKDMLCRQQMNNSFTTSENTWVVQMGTGLIRQQ